MISIGELFGHKYYLEAEKTSKEESTHDSHCQVQPISHVYLPWRGGSKMKIWSQQQESLSKYLKDCCVTF